MIEENTVDPIVSAQADGIFCAALAYETVEERRAFVEEACQGNAALRREVDRLFEALAASEALFEGTSHLMIPAKDLIEVLANLQVDFGT